jgi:hypothetical protein
MPFQNKGYVKRKSVPNSLKRKPVMSFKTDLSPGALDYLKGLTKVNAKSQFINRAIEMRYMYERDTRRFLKITLREYYSLARHLLRKIGQEIKSGR